MRLFLNDKSLPMAAKPLPRRIRVGPTGWSVVNSGLMSECGTAFGAVNGDRKQTSYTFVSWRVVDNQRIGPSMTTGAFLGTNPTDEP